MSAFSQRIRHLEIAADPDDGDGFKFVVARHGETRGYPRRSSTPTATATTAP
jgi:hypothetical protein